MTGLWALFQKPGLKGWWALIPGAGKYQLSRCAGREPEGRVYSIVSVSIILLNIISLLIPLRVEGLNDQAIAEVILNRLLIISIFNLPLVFTAFVYSIRIWSGMIEVCGVRKRWMWLCLLSYTKWIPTLVWGLCKAYQPEWKVEDLKAEMARLASSGSAKVMDEGLTVNLKERTASEFFQKKTLLRNIHMAIPQGHLVLLLGGSGAGYGNNRILRRAVYSGSRKRFLSVSDHSNTFSRSKWDICCSAAIPPTLFPFLLRAGP